MLQESKQEAKNKEFLDRAISQVKNMGYDEIKACHEDYEDPAAFSLKGEDVKFRPDITANKMGGKYYFEIADRTENSRLVRGKWKLLETLAKMKNGELKIFVPRGCMKFTNTLLAETQIQASIIKLS